MNGVVFFRGPSVFDGRAPIGEADVLVRDGAVEAVAFGLCAPEEADVVEARGLTLLPGLIDSHVHIGSYDHLAQCFNFGVTTVIDMFHGAGLIWEWSRRAETDPSAARVVSAGIGATVPGGHPFSTFGGQGPTVTTVGGVPAFVEDRLAEGSQFLKLIYETGSTYGLTLPTLSVETLGSLVNEAHRREVLAVMHIGSAAGAAVAVEAGADCLAHLFVDFAPEAGFVERVAARRPVIIPTLSVLHAVRPESSGCAIVRDPRLRSRLDDNWVPHLESGGGRKYPTARYEYAIQTLEALASAGMPIMAGTDAAIQGTAYGASLHRELELMVEAGMSAHDALVAATSRPADFFGLARRGVIGEGSSADLLLVRGDPVRDITATREIVGVWRGR